MVFLICPWTLFLVPGSGLGTETLWDGTHWGGLSLGSAQLLAQHSPVLLSPDSTSQKSGFRVDPLILIYGIVCGPFFLRSFSTSDAAYRNRLLSQWALQWRQHTADQYITACEYILRIMSNKVRCLPCVSKYLVIVIGLCLFVPGSSNEHTASRQVMETSSNQYFDFQEKISSSL